MYVKLLRITHLTDHLSLAVSDNTYPRIQVMEDLLSTIRSQSGLAKDASSALIELGEAISSTASREDISVLLHGLLTQEPHVRNACLQALQV